MSRQMKVKSLSLSRKTQPSTSPRTEDPGNIAIPEGDRARVARLEVALNSPIARPSRQCSTPIHNNGDAAEDSPDQDLAGSPISMFLCTQESVGEVAWDWNGGRETSGRNGMLDVTPKRRQLMKKKRLAKGNSPLMNLPPKRKIAQPDNVDRINKFAEEFQALAEKIKSEQEIEAEKRSEAVGDISDMVTQLVREPEPDIHEAQTRKVDESLQDLFDDSIDACMVRCSQEIEDKLRLESTETSVDKEDGKGRKTERSRDARRKVEKKDESGARCEIPASQIPDDSLDDCLALCLEDDDDLVSKFLEPKKLRNEGAGSSGAKKSYSNIGDGVSSTIKEPADASPCFKRKQHCMSWDALPSTQSRKFFKSKSLSDSMCAKSNSEKAKRSMLNPNANSKSGCGRNSSSPMSKCASNTNLSSRTSTSDDAPLYKLDNAVSPAGGRSDTARCSSVNNRPRNSHVSYSYLRNGVNVPPLERAVGNWEMSSEKSTRDFKGSQLQCTAAEIERKRAEARMKLEANRLKKQSSFDRSKAGVNFGAAKRPPVVKR